MVIFVTMFTMLLNEVIADKLEALRKERRIGVYTLCNRAAVSYETYRGIRKKKEQGYLPAHAAHPAQDAGRHACGVFFRSHVSTLLLASRGKYSIGG